MTRTLVAGGRLKRCKYQRRNGELCTAPALDQSDDALIYICLKHGGRVLQMMAEAKAARLGLRRPA